MIYALSRCLLLSYLKIQELNSIELIQQIKSTNFQFTRIVVFLLDRVEDGE